MDYTKKLTELLYLTIQSNASDLHFSIGHKPILRVDGKLMPIETEIELNKDAIEGLVDALLRTQERKDEFAKTKELDFSYELEDKARFRVNTYFQKGQMAAAMRYIPFKIRTLEELSLPKTLEKFCSANQGFVLVVGPIGHGKSTTLAALIDIINKTRTDHIITIEDPIEYIYVEDKAIIDQREIHQDTESFITALRSVFRQDADVVMIGEMRDVETMGTAVTAAETGHLVFSTLHTNSAAQTIDRIIDSFPAERQGQIRAQLANSLLGIVSQRLVPRIGGGLMPAIEILIANYAVRTLIRENKIHQIDLVIETSLAEGMISMNRSLANLYLEGKITRESAEIYSFNPDGLKTLLKEDKKRK